MPLSEREYVQLARSHPYRFRFRDQVSRVNWARGVFQGDNAGEYVKPCSGWRAVESLEAFIQLMQEPPGK